MHWLFSSFLRTSPNESTKMMQVKDMMARIRKDREKVKEDREIDRKRDERD